MENCPESAWPDPLDAHFTDVEVAVPAFLTIILMPFAYSITVGIGIGFIMLIVMKAVMGKVREIHPLMWLVGALFVLYFLQGLIGQYV